MFSEGIEGDSLERDRHVEKTDKMGLDALLKAVTVFKVIQILFISEHHIDQAGLNGGVLEKGCSVHCLSALPDWQLHFRKAPDTFKFLRHVIRAILSARPKCSHRCVSRKETPLKRVGVLTHATRRSTEQTSMRTKWFKHIAI